MSLCFCTEEKPLKTEASYNIYLTFCLHGQEATRPALPILLAVGAVHQHLIQNGLRMSASIVADTAQCFSTHQFACLIGYGARLCSYCLHILSSV